MKQGRKATRHIHFTFGKQKKKGREDITHLVPSFPSAYVRWPSSDCRSNVLSRTQPCSSACHTLMSGLCLQKIRYIACYHKDTGNGHTASYTTILNLTHPSRRLHFPAEPTRLFPNTRCTAAGLSDLPQPISLCSLTGTESHSDLHCLWG